MPSGLGSEINGWFTLGRSGSGLGMIGAGIGTFGKPGMASDGSAGISKTNFALEVFKMGRNSGGGLAFALASSSLIFATSRSVLTSPWFCSSSEVCASFSLMIFDSSFSSFAPPA
jgi:hypothetical protein